MPPDPPYTAVIFSAQRIAGGERYAAAAAQMEALAATAPGYLGHRSARGPDGFGITVSYWRTPADADAFRRLPAHRAMQAEGRADWYDWYVSETATVERVRTGQSEGPKAPSASSRASMPDLSADQ